MRLDEEEESSWPIHRVGQITFADGEGAATNWLASAPNIRPPRSADVCSATPMIVVLGFPRVSTEHLFQESP